MALGEARRPGYIDGGNEEPQKGTQNIQIGSLKIYWLINWVLYSMEESIASSFKYCDTVKEL